MAQGRVVYLAHEDIPHQTKEHFQGLRLTADDPLKYLRGYADDPRETLDHVAALIAGNDVRLVILDPLAGSLDIKDGNDYFEVYRIMRNLRPIAVAAGAHILVVHHDNKNTEAKGQNKVLGSRGFTAGPDTILFFGRSEGTRTLAGDMRDGGEIEKIILDLDDTGMPQTAGTARERNHAKLHSEILDFLADRTDPAKVGDIRTAVGGNAQELSNVLAGAVCGRAGFYVPKGAGKALHPE